MLSHLPGHRGLRYRRRPIRSWNGPGERRKDCSLSEEPYFNDDDWKLLSMCFVSLIGVLVEEIGILFWDLILDLCRVVLIGA